MKKIIFLILLLHSICFGQWAFYRYENEWKEEELTKRVMLCHTNNEIPAVMSLTWNWNSEEDFLYYVFKIFLLEHKFPFEEGKSITIKMKNGDNIQSKEMILTSKNSLGCCLSLDDIGYLAGEELKIIIDLGDEKTLLVFDTKEFEKYFMALELLNKEEHDEWLKNKK